MKIDEKMANQSGKELSRVASLIRPLPDNVVPSDEFLRRMRLRILKLRPAPRDGQQAA
jgi:hypothetical protein